MRITAADLARYRSALNVSLPETATIVRTNATMACRVTQNEQHGLVEGNKWLFRPMRWRLAFPFGTDVRTGDTVRVTGLGTYWLSSVESPESYSWGIVADAVRSDTPVVGIPMITNATATFTRAAKPTDTLTTGVFLYDAAVDIHELPEAAKYELAALVDPTLRYPSGAPISAMDRITWTPPNGVQRTETISKPHYQYGLWASMVVYFATT